MPQITLTRQEVYDRVWTTPTDRLAKEFGLSGRGLGKLCARHHIPVPPRGHWAKKAAGQRVIQAPLPAATPRTATTLRFTPQTIEPGQDTAASQPPDVHPLIAFEQNAANRIVVPGDLPIADGRLVKTRTLLAKAKRDNTGRVAPPISAAPIRTSRDAHERALRIMQALLAGFASRGFAVTRAGDGYQVQVLDEALGFCLEEDLAAVEHRITFTEQKLIDRGLGSQVPKKDWIPSGQLVLVITNVRGVRQRWTESSKRLEDRLNNFLVGLVRAALGLKAQRAEAERLRLEQEERERRRQEEVRRRAERAHQWREERGRVGRIERLLELWERQQRLEALIHNLERTLGPIDADTEVGKWLSWAREHVTDSDPIARMADGLHGTLTVYYHGYDANQILSTGFSEPTQATYPEKEVQAGIELTTCASMRDHYYGGPLKFELPEALLLPYEWLQQTSWTWRTFRVPAALLNRTLGYGTA